MEKYLRKLELLENKRINRIDIDEFIESCLFYFQNRKLEINIRNKLLNMIDSSKSTAIKKICYKVLAIDGEIKEISTISRDLKDTELADSVIFFLNTSNNFEYDIEIYENLVCKENLQSNEIIKFFMRNNELTTDFLSKNSTKFLLFQLELISCQNQLNFDLHYFANFLGSENKIIALKTAEAFLLFEKKSKTKLEIQFEKLEIESQTNFEVFRKIFHENQRLSTKNSENNINTTLELSERDFVFDFDLLFEQVPDSIYHRITDCTEF